jgi:ligand-binding sensor domain-containing protein/two-component sensor histidine kinase
VNYLKAITILFLSLNAFPASNEYIFRQLTVEDGLSQSTVFATLQDSRGYMWFGTIDGLNRYDGYNFMVFTNNPSDSTTISDNVIISIFEDSRKQMWIGTVNGYINKFNWNTETFDHYFVRDFFEVELEPPGGYYEYPLAFSRNMNISVSSIAEDQLGYLWIGTWGNGVIRFDPVNKKAIHFYNKIDDKNTISFNRITRVLASRDGTIWIGTFGNGLNKIEFENPSQGEEISYRVTHYKHSDDNSNSLADDRIISLFEDPDKTIWVGTFSGGVNQLNYEQRNLTGQDAKFINYRKIENTNNCLCNNTVMDIVMDNSGYLWLATFGGGVDRFDKKSGGFVHFYNDPTDPFSLPENDILSLAVDRSGILWVGSHIGEGVTLVRENRAKISHLKNVPGNPNSLNDDVIWSILNDENGNLWIGTYSGGLNRFNYGTGKFKAFQHDAGNTNTLSDDHVRVIRKDRFNNLWIGTYYGGVNKFNTRTGEFTSYVHSNDDSQSISGNQIQDIFIESDSVIWVATFGSGLNKFSFNENSSVSVPKITIYQNDPSDTNSISDDRLYNIFKDSDGNLWIGTYGGGLNKMDRITGKFMHYKNILGNPHSLSNNKVVAITEDSNHMLWLGTSGGGLNKFDRELNTFTRYSQNKGLTSAVVYGILEDEAKNLWMSTDNGIFKFDLNSENFTHFDLEDGLQSLEFNGGSYFQDKSRQLYFGGINGLNIFYPDSIRTNLFVPPIVITSINVLNNRIKGDASEIILTHDQNFISFEFSALDYTNPKNNKYAFRLDGLDDDWNYVDAKRRIANYINLPAGDFTFHVTGTNSDGLWNRGGTSILISITPPFWQTWWFITLMVILIGAIIYYVSTVRIKHQLAIEKIKTRVAADLHDNVGASLTEISILSEVAVHKSNNDSDIKELRSISNIARQLVDTMSDIVFVVNPERDSLYDLIIKLKDSYNDFLQSVGISFKVTNIDKTNDIKLPMDYKQNLLLIFKEGINNAIKHSRCNKIVLEANIRGDVIEMILSDNGIGFDELNTGTGNGIRNMETRAGKINGRMKWRSSVEKGTVIQFIGRISRFNKIKSLLNV